MTIEIELLKTKIDLVQHKIIILEFQRNELLHMLEIKEKEQNEQLPTNS